MNSPLFQVLYGTISFFPLLCLPVHISLFLFCVLTTELRTALSFILQPRWGCSYFRMFFNVFTGARMSILSHVLARVLLAVGTYMGHNGWFCFWMVPAHMYCLIDSVSNSRPSLRSSVGYVIDHCSLLSHGIGRNTLGKPVGQRKRNLGKDTIQSSRRCMFLDCCE